MTMTPKENWRDIAGRLELGRHVLPVRIYYEDTDFSGVVYHAAYLKFLERGRSDFLRLCGVHHHELAAGAFGAMIVFAVRHMEIDFLKPARIDDLLEIETRLIIAKGARLVLEQEIRRGEERLFRASVTVAVMTSEGKPTRLPEVLRRKLTSHVDVPQP